MSAPATTAESPARWWLPRTLFGRLLLVLTGGLLVAQLLSAALNFVERDRLLDRSFGRQALQRMVDVVALLDESGPSERDRLQAIFRVPPFVLTIADAPRVALDEPPAGPARRLAERLREAFGDGREVRVEPRIGYAHPGAGAGAGAGAGNGSGRGPGPGHARGPNAGGMNQAVLRAEMQLRDGRWARFDLQQPEAPQALPLRLALTLAVLLISVLALSYWAVRWVVRPLRQLTQAAEALGRDLDQVPLPEKGPLEVQQAARAFNTMQRRLAGFINDRTRVLAALSHDLKTPLTRLRLRAELLDDETLRDKIEADLAEMQTMVQQTLEVMRGFGPTGPREAVDVNAVVAALQADQLALGRAPLPVEAQALAPWWGVSSLLKRCLGNLVDNAAAYGGSARLRIEDSPIEQRLLVIDECPGIPPTELERVFEPFHRLEASRNRATGGTGLGLGIARDIARSFGGDVVLRNRPEGGLEAQLSLPRPSD